MLCNKSLLIFLDALHTTVDSFYTGMFSEWHFQDSWMTFRWLLMTFWWLAIRPRKLKYDFRCLCMIWTCWHWHIMKNSTMLNILFKSYINHFFLFSGKTKFFSCFKESNNNSEIEFKELERNYLDTSNSMNSNIKWTLHSQLCDSKSFKTIKLIFFPLWCLHECSHDMH